MTEKETLHVAIVGLGNTQGTFTSSMANGKSFDEVWAINSMMVPIKHDRVFMMDPASRFLDTENAGPQTGAMRKALGDHPGPIYTCTLDDRVPGAVLYPLEEIVKETGLCNLVMAEAGRACTEFWLSVAIARGMQVEVAHDSTLLDTNVPDEEKLYGYHRLDDPLVMSVKDGCLSVAKRSESSPPEPTDEPILYGRHDKVVLLKEAVNV